MLRKVLIAALGAVLFPLTAAADNFALDTPDRDPAAQAKQDGAACTLPGELLVEDAEGDGLIPLEGVDTIALYAAEPADLPGKIAVTMKIGSFDPVAPPNSTFYARWQMSDGVEYFFSYDPYDATTNTGTLGLFEYGHVEVDPVTGVSNLTTDGQADAESNAAADGTITWVLTKDLIPALTEYPDMFNIIGEARLLIGTSATGGLVYTADDTPAGYYEFRDEDACEGKSALESIVAGGFGLTLLLPLGLALFYRGRCR